MKVMASEFGSSGDISPKLNSYGGMNSDDEQILNRSVIPQSNIISPKPIRESIDLNKKRKTPLEESDSE
jgi:hypothetical protein